MRTLITLPFLLGGLALGASACQFTQAVDDDEIEAQISRKLGITADCPGDLSGEVGATLRCTAANAPGVAAVTVTVTSVEGDQVDFTMKAGT
ncbi:hypothetical protein GCM10009678_07910 [Actinomadura kijaniata]|uniref:DUF4333 domain-containing protein n=1 Tax=Actinomadura namibiensis TaxID=182080 RepID=A0A7W3LW26_ACTNM|nr:DUF4333 domain-containing protein [Actinomadura namibiensis]MBA8955311.1 hypothetical protein [Actinomadura namibiensis]